MAELISGASSFATEGERMAAEVLRQLPASWLVICNKTLPLPNGRSYEMDFIVVGKRWVFLLDEKSWQGKIIGNEEQWVRVDGTSERSPLAKADYVAKVLAGRLGWSIPPLKNGYHFVRGGILLSIADELPIIRDPRAAQGVFLLDDVCQRLQQLDGKGGNEDVGRFRDAIKKSLVDLSNRLAVPQRINDILTVGEAITMRPGVRLFRATMDGGDTRQLMVYDLTTDPISPDELRKFYQREFHILKELHDTGLVAEVETPFIWSDNFFIVPIVPLKGQPLSTYRLPETTEELSLELLLAAASFRALDTIHSRNILHRAIGADTVYIMQGGQNPKVAFTNFFAARMGTASIATQLDKQGLVMEDPYASFDLAVGYEYALPATDTFSLALVFLERIAGIPILAIRANVESDVSFPDIQQRWSFIPVDIANELAALFRRIVIPDKQNLPPKTKEIADILTKLARRLRSELPEERYFQNKRYKMQRILGQGAMARTYLASYTDDDELGLCVLKQFLRPEDVYEQAKAEYLALKNLKSKYFPTIMDIFPREDDVHIKMEYIPGPTLQEIIRSFPLALDRWWAFAQDLLNALEELENRQILHRDIKPANIILHENDNHPVLIDFGFAVKQLDMAEARPGGTPLYLPPETLTSSQLPPTIDRYAAGVVLFQVLTGSLPFELNDGQHRKLHIPPDITDEKVRRIAGVLLRVVSNDPTQRPTSTTQMRQELQNALLAVDEPPEMQRLLPQINAWVGQIRGLYRNSATGNADNRGLDSDFVRKTYVQTALDRQLLPAIFAHRPAAVFLTGNPGDGKTAFLEQVQQELRHNHALPRDNSDASGWEWNDAGHVFRSCYDASESHREQSADDQLLHKLQGLEGPHAPNLPLTVLVAINDGRLADFFNHYGERFLWLAHQIEQARKVLSLESSPVWVIDLKRRAFVRFPDADNTEPSIFARILQRLVAGEQWKICDTCAAQTICPIRQNAAALRKKRVQQALEHLLLLTHLRRHRHMTMRDLRSALAYLITGNADCAYIHSARSDEEVGATLENLKYWRSVFAPSEMQDELLKDITSLDPARFPHPHLDRYLHFHQSIADVDARRVLFADETDLPVQRYKDEIEWIGAVKRRLYFEAKSAKAQESAAQTLPRVRSLALLPYKYARDFIDLLDNNFDDEAMEAIRENIALGLLRSDGIIEDLPEGTLSLQVRASEAQQLIVLKQFPLTDFTLYAEPIPEGDIIERLPEIVIFAHQRGYPRLEITLDLFELLMRMANGLLPDAIEFQPLLEDLKPFKDALILGETRDLVLIESRYRMHSITQEASKIVRTTM